MKVIDAMMKISRGEEVKFKLLNGTDTIYHLIHGCYLYDETNEEEVEWFINEDWLNREIEIIEEEPRNIEVCGSLFTRSEYNKLAGIEEDKNKKIERITNKAFLNAPFGELVGGKINEIIDVLNEMREDK